MGFEQRRHIRFSLDIPGIRYTKYGEAIETVIRQISIGGCLAESDESVYIGDEFRLLLQLPNKNFLPLLCKAMYKFSDHGIGTKFLDISQFEQELLSEIITRTLADEGLPMQVDPFAQPKRLVINEAPQVADSRRQKEEILENILSGNRDFYS